jgi:hypothetical protein
MSDASDLEEHTDLVCEHTRNCWKLAAQLVQELLEAGCQAAKEDAPRVAEVASSCSQGFRALCERTQPGCGCMPVRAYT